MPSTTPELHVHEGEHGPELWATPRPPAGARLVSYSELQSMDCWLKHHYAYAMRLKPVQRYVALTLGSAWDAFYNEWHAGTGQPPVTPDRPGPVPALPDTTLDPDLVAALTDGWSSELHDRVGRALAHADHELRREARRVDGELADKDLPRPMDWAEQLAELRTTVHGMALHYVARWREEPNANTLGVQVRFAVPLPSATGGRSNKYYLHGVLDRLVQHGSELWIVDAKLRMGTIEDDYRESFERDPQLELYGWAMREAGWNVVGGYIDASSAALPRWPQLKAQPETVYTDEVDEAGKPVPLTEPVPCKECDGFKAVPGEAGAVALTCPRCDGDGVERFASGKRKGEVKTTTVKRPALYAGWENMTTLPVAMAALQAHGLPLSQYDDELQHLHHQWSGAVESRYHWRMEPVPYTQPQLDRASLSARGVAGYLDQLPPVPNPSKMKCKYCNFKTLCPSTHPADAGEDFTTPEQRAAVREARRELEAAQAALGDDDPTTSPAELAALDVF